MLIREDRLRCICAGDLENVLEYHISSIKESRTVDIVLQRYDVSRAVFLAFYSIDAITSSEHDEIVSLLRFARDSCLCSLKAL